MIDIVLYGAGGYGKEVLGILKDYNKKAKKFKILGLPPGFWDSKRMAPKSAGNIGIAWIGMLARSTEITYLLESSIN